MVGAVPSSVHSQASQPAPAPAFDWFAFERFLGIAYVAWWLGHASIKTTETYARVQPEDMRRFIESRPRKDPYGG